MSYLTASFQDWSPFLFILLAGALPTQVWRWAGAFLSRSMDVESDLMKWVRAVATALVSGLIAKLVVFPVGVLVQVPVWVLISALIIGYLIYLFKRSTIIFGIITAEIFIIIYLITVR